MARWCWFSSLFFSFFTELFFSIIARCGGQKIVSSWQRQRQTHTNTVANTETNRQSVVAQRVRFKSVYLSLERGWKKIWHLAIFGDIVWLAGEPTHATPSTVELSNGWPTATAGTSWHLCWPLPWSGTEWCLPSRTYFIEFFFSCFG